MKKTNLLAIVALLAMAAPAYADEMPYFGATSHDGSYWNGPKRDYQASGPSTAPNHGYSQQQPQMRNRSDREPGMVR